MLTPLQRLITSILKCVIGLIYFLIDKDGKHKFECGAYFFKGKIIMIILINIWIICNNCAIKQELFKLCTCSNNFKLHICFLHKRLKKVRFVWYFERLNFIILMILETSWAHIPDPSTRYFWDTLYLTKYDSPNHNNTHFWFIYQWVRTEVIIYR